MLGVKDDAVAHPLAATRWHARPRLAIAIRVVANGFIGLGARPVGAPWGLDSFALGELNVQWRHVAMFATLAVVVAFLWWFFRRTRHGLAMTAAAFDQAMILLLEPATLLPTVRTANSPGFVSRETIV